MMKGPEREAQEEIMREIRLRDTLSRIPLDPPDEAYERDDDDY